MRCLPRLERACGQLLKRNTGSREALSFRDTLWNILGQPSYTWTDTHNRNQHKKRFYFILFWVSLLVCHHSNYIMDKNKSHFLDSLFFTVSISPYLFQHYQTNTELSSRRLLFVSCLKIKLNDNFFFCNFTQQTKIGHVVRHLLNRK